MIGAKSGRLTIVIVSMPDGAVAAFVVSAIAH